MTCTDHTIAHDHFAKTILYSSEHSLNKFADLHLIIRVFLVIAVPIICVKKNLAVRDDLGHFLFDIRRDDAAVRAAITSVQQAFRGRWIR